MKRPPFGRPRGDRRAPDARRSRRWTPSAQWLEARTLLTISIEFDYSLDANNFFNTQAKRDVLQAAANQIASELDDHLLAIQPSGTDTWTAEFPSPSTGATVSVSNLTVPADTIIIYVGGRSLGDSGEAGDGSTGGFQVGGDSNWIDTVAARGKSGALAATPTAYGPWGGSIAFDNSSTNWFFGTSTSGLTSNETDFFTVAEHEIGHVLGIGTSPVWQDQVSGGYFTGANAEATYGGPVPTDPAGAHWAEGTMSGGTPAVMDPALLNGTRIDFTPLDFAGLADLGWAVESSPSSQPSVFQFSAPAYSAPASSGSATITVDRSGGTGAASVVVTLSGGTAQSGVDDNAQTTTLNFPAGATSESYTFTLHDDPSAQGNPTINFTLSSPSASAGASIGSVGNATLTIVESASHTAFDVDGDGRADLDLFRQSSAQWIVAPTGNESWNVFSFGASNMYDIPVAADFDGVGHSEIAVYRPSTGQWFIPGHSAPIQFGGPDDIPVPADYDGVGHAELAVYRPSTGQWFIAGHSQPITFGAPNLDVPVPADYGGLGYAQIAVFRPSTAQWFIAGRSQPVQFGASNLYDIPVPADYLGTGSAQFAVFRVSTGQWIIGGDPEAIQFGASNLYDIPVEGAAGAIMLLRQESATNHAMSVDTASAPETARTAQAAPLVIAPATMNTESKAADQDIWLAALEAMDSGLA